MATTDGLTGTASTMSPKAALTRRLTIGGAPSNAHITNGETSHHLEAAAANGSGIVIGISNLTVGISTTKGVETGKPVTVWK